MILIQALGVKSSTQFTDLGPICKLTKTTNKKNTFTSARLDSPDQLIIFVTPYPVRPVCNRNTTAAARADKQPAALIQPSCVSFTQAAASVKPF